MLCTYRVLLLLDVELMAILEDPLHNVSLGRGTFDLLALIKLGPELVEVLELDEMPHITRVGLDDGGLADRR